MTTYPADFETAMVQLFLDEGGYDNDPDDPGGETKYGIDKRTYPNVDIRALTKDGAKAIYFADWWTPYVGWGMPSPVQAKMFNVAVNVGRGQANKFLQRALGVAADGWVGAKTLAAIAAATKLDPDGDTLLTLLRMQQSNFYEGLAAHNPTLRKFLRGWLRRAAE